MGRCNGWLRRQWRAYLESYDHQLVLAASSPSAAATGTLALVGLFWALALLPTGQTALLREPIAPSILAALGGALTWTAWRHRCQGRVGALATLLDNACYSGALLVAISEADHDVSLILSVLLVVMGTSFPARHYGLTTLFAATMSLPVLLTLLLAPPNSLVVVVLSAYLVTTFSVSYTTGKRLTFAHQRIQWQRAMEVADTLAAQSLRTVEARTLISLSQLLHELRNLQTVVSSNLSFLREVTPLDPEGREALEDIVEAARRQDEVLKSATEALATRVHDGSSPGIPLAKVLEQFGTHQPTGEVRTTLGPCPPNVMVSAAPALFGAMGTIAKQASRLGATELNIEVLPDPSGRSVSLSMLAVGVDVQPSAITNPKDTPTGESRLGMSLIIRYLATAGGTVRQAATPVGWKILLSIPVTMTGTEPSSTIS